MKKNAFTMIELIFVIVILGVLAAVAIPKLAATRDDALQSTECSNISTCVTDVAAEYTAKETTTSVTSAASCIAATRSGVTLSVTADTLTVTGNLCTTLNGTTTFGGNRVSL